MYIPNKSIDRTLTYDIDCTREPWGAHTLDYPAHPQTSSSFYSNYATLNLFCGNKPSISGSTSSTPKNILLTQFTKRKKMGPKTDKNS